MRKVKNGRSPGGSPYSANTLAWLRKTAMQVEGAVEVGRNMFPRAYCIAKPAPGCAVFVTPWMDAMPPVCTPGFSSSQIIREGVFDVRVGDWCALAYVSREQVSEWYAFKLPEPVKTTDFEMVIASRRFYTRRTSR